MLFKIFLFQPSWLAERNHLDIFCRGHYKEYFCKFILNLGLGSVDDVLIILYRAMVAILFGRAEPFRHFGKEHLEEHLCKIWVRLWFRRIKRFTDDERRAPDKDQSQ